MSNNVINFTVNMNGNAVPVAIELNDAVQKVVSSVRNAETQLEKFGNTAFQLDSITNVVDKVSQAFQSLVGSSLEFEQEQANLRTLLNGDAEATENLVSQIREYGKATVYDKSSLVEAQKTMMTFGLDAEFAFGKLKNIGDIALGDKQKMQSLALAFSQASSSGKLMGQDLMQMINAGFNPLEVISRNTRKSMSQLKTEMSKGKITADMLAQSLEWATEEGGRFYKGAENAADTTAGKIAKVNGAIDDLKMKLFEATHGATAWIAEAGNMFVPIAQMLPLLTAMGTLIKKCRQQWTKFKNKVTTDTPKICLNLGFLNVSIAAVAGFFHWLAVQAKISCRVISVAIMNIPIIGWIAAIVAVIIGVVTLLWNKSEGFRRVVFGVFESVKAIVHNVWVVIKQVVEFVIGVIKILHKWIRDELLKPIANLIRSVLKKLTELIWDKFLKPIIEQIKMIIAFAWKTIKSVVDWIVNTAQTVWKAIVNVAKSIGDFFVKLWDDIVNAAKALWDAIVNVAKSIGAFFVRLWDNIVNTAKTVWKVIVNVAKSIGDFFVGVWNNVVTVARTVWNTIVEVATSIGDFFAGIWDWIAEKFQMVIDWIVEKLSNIGSWLNEHILEPIRELFSEIWDVVERILNAIKEKLKKLLQPIIELWNKVFKNDQLKSVSEAYNEGAEKGSESWQKSQEEKDASSDVSVLDPEADGGKKDEKKDKKGKTKTSDGALGNTAGTVAGKTQQIHITLGNMVGTMNFNGNLRENASDVEKQLTEMMARILGMAETSA